jgi:hypothetical protein
LYILTNIYPIHNSSAKKCTKILGNPIWYYLKRKMGRELREERERGGSERERERG